jgi:DNA-binding NarL/FixJ family response regulator
VEGFDVVGEASDGATALGDARRLKPDIVLLDIHLPDFDGFEVAERLAAEETGPAVVFTPPVTSRTSVQGSTKRARGFVLTRSRESRSSSVRLSRSTESASARVGSD